MPSEHLRLAEPDCNPRAERFCRAFLAGERPRYVFGITPQTEALVEKFELAGIIEDNPSRPRFRDVPVVVPQDVPGDALVVNLVVYARLVTAEKRLARFRFDQLDYFAFREHAGVELPEVLFQKGMREDIERHFERYDALFRRMADETSRNELHNLLNFRRTRDLSFMRGFVHREHEQYFEPFLRLGSRPEVFVDVGGFDGYTSAEFARRVPDYRAIHVFEPENANISVAKQRLAPLRDTTFHELGLSDAAGEVHFSARGSGSGISDSGDQVIRVERLDAVVDAPVTFIKMDVEGAELQALRGARGTIEKHHPSLAVAAYHEKDALWRLSDFVLSIRDDYDLHLRHYTEGVNETILFFVPRR